MKTQNSKMKNTALILCLLIFAFCVQEAHADITTGLVAQYKFDEGSGTIANDSSGNGYTGTLTNSPTWTSGKIGPYAVNTNTPGFSSSEVTVSSVPLGSTWTAGWWSYFPLATFNSSWRTMFRSFTSGADHQVIVDSSGNLGMFDNDFGSAFNSSGYNINSLSGWHFVTAVYTGGVTTFYIDASSVGTVTKTNTDNVDVIGNYQGGGQNWGIIDELRIYSRALSSSDIAQLYVYSEFGMMSSTNYSIQSDSVNFGGGYSTSANYIQESTGGEIATGISSSTNYIMGAGYQQMTVVVLSLVPPGSVIMSPAIGGVTGGTSNGSTTFTVTTDDPAGYTANIQASSSPALVNTASSSNAFADYSPSGSAPDFSFGITATASAFAFSPQGTDADQRFKNNTSICNSGTNSTAQTCWDGLSTVTKTIAGRTSNNTPTGTQTTLYFRAASGTNHIQVNGVYVATTTLTVLPL
jgi:hypothetical protein